MADNEDHWYSIHYVQPMTFLNETKWSTKQAINDLATPTKYTKHEQGDLISVRPPFPSGITMDKLCGSNKIKCKMN